MFGFCWLVALFVKWVFLGCQFDVKSGQVLCRFEQSYPLHYLDILIGSGLIAILVPLISNRVLSDRKVGMRIARKSSLIANVVLDALDERFLVQITTARGKMYIGWVMHGPGISQQGQLADIAVVPLFSGHRDVNTQELSKDIDYSDALTSYRSRIKSDSEVTNTGSPEETELSVVIPIGEIALIRWHSEELWGTFTSAESSDEHKSNYH